MARKPVDEALFSAHIRRGRDEQYKDFLRRNARTDAFAFVDESYQPTFADRQGFYVLTATVVQGREVPQMREALKSEMNGRAYWHTTEAYRAQIDGDGPYPGIWRGKIPDMLAAAADHTDQTVMTVHTALPGPAGVTSNHRDASTSHVGALNDRALEEARAECLTTLLTRLAHHPDGEVNAIVMESRASSGGKNLDAVDSATITRLRQGGYLPGELEVTTARPSTEPNLWAADLFAWSANRELARNDSKWLGYAPNLEWIDAQTGQVLNGAPQPEAPAGLQRGYDHQAVRGPIVSPRLAQMVDEIKALPAVPAHTRTLDMGRGQPSMREQARRRAAAPRSTQLREQEKRRRGTQSSYKPDDRPGGPERGHGIRR